VHRINDEHDCVGDCMSDEEKMREFPDTDQRLAVCIERCESNNSKHRDKDRRKRKDNSDCSCGGHCVECRNNPQTNTITAKYAHFTNNLKASLLKTVMFEGQRHIVMPVVLIKQGVLNGIFYSSEELRKFPEAWNGRPVPILHPKKDDEPISANSPKVLEQQNVGILFNVSFEDDSLKGEIWLNEKKMLKIAPNLLRKLRDGIMIEVSTGLFIEMEETRGRFEGNEFFAEAFNFRPDHLALLPGEVGACSIEDGCGTPRTNEVDKGESMNFVTRVLSFLTQNKSKEKEQEILQLIEPKELQPMQVENNKKQENTMEEKVSELIAHTGTQFDETDRPWLLALDEEQLDKLAPKANDDDEAKKAEAEKAAALKAQEEADEAAKQKAAKEAEEAEKAKELETADSRDLSALMQTGFAELAKQLPELVSSAVQARTEEQEQETIIAQLTANGEYEADDLKGMNLKVLKKMASLSFPGVYMGSATAHNTGEEAMSPTRTLFANAN